MNPIVDNCAFYSFDFEETLEIKIDNAHHSLISISRNHPYLKSAYGKKMKAKSTRQLVKDAERLQAIRN